MRIAPGQDGPAAVAALRAHLEKNVPWGARLTVSDEGYGDAFKLTTTGSVYDAFRAGDDRGLGSRTRRDRGRRLDSIRRVLLRADAGGPDPPDRGG